MRLNVEQPIYVVQEARNIGGSKFWNTIEEYQDELRAVQRRDELSARKRDDWVEVR